MDMGEPWIFLWVICLIGLFVNILAIYDYVDRKKRGQQIKLWKYALAISIGLVLMFPVVSGIVGTLPLSTNCWGLRFWACCWAGFGNANNRVSQCLNRLE